MKSIKSISFILLLTVLPAILFAKGDKNKTETASIQTSAQCESCKSRIESAVKELKGVKSADLNLDDKKVTVIYSPKKVSTDEIKKAISKAGYDADEVTADSDAYSKLPACCKKGGHE